VVDAVGIDGGVSVFGVCTTLRTLALGFEALIGEPDPMAAGVSGREPTDGVLEVARVGFTGVSDSWTPLGSIGDSRGPASASFCVAAAMSSFPGSWRLDEDFAGVVIFDFTADISDSLIGVSKL